MTLKAVVLDSREPQWVQELDLGVPSSVTTLPIGDAWLAAEDTTLVVERKTLADLLASIQDNRLFTQAAAMVQQSAWSYEVVTELPVIRSGCVWAGGKLTNWKWSSVQGALMTLQDIGVQVVWWPNSHQGYADALKFLADRDRQPVKVHPQKREVVMQSQAEAILCGLPGISDGRAGTLLEHCGTAAFALDFLTGNGGGSVPGIGPGTKSAVRQALGLPDDLRLAVIDRQEATSE